MALQHNFDSENKKTARLEARVRPEIKERVEFAANLTGVTSTDFVVASCLEAANKAIEQYHVIRLSQKDAECFVDSLLNPTAPSQELRDAAERYRKRTGK